MTKTINLGGAMLYVVVPVCAYVIGRYFGRKEMGAAIISAIKEATEELKNEM